MNIAERAVNALREAADAVDALPQALRRNTPIFGTPLVNTDTLRNEAQWIDDVTKSVASSLKVVE